MHSCRMLSTVCCLEAACQQKLGQVMLQSSLAAVQRSCLPPRDTHERCFDVRAHVYCQLYHRWVSHHTCTLAGKRLKRTALELRYMHHVLLAAWKGSYKEDPSSVSLLHKRKNNKLKMQEGDAQAAGSGGQQ